MVMNSTSAIPVTPTCERPFRVSFLGHLVLYRGQPLGKFLFIYLHTSRLEPESIVQCKAPETQSLRPPDVPIYECGHVRQPIHVKAVNREVINKTAPTTK